MKVLFLNLILAVLISTSCNRPARELATVEIGMTKDEVKGIVGEPEKKDVINQTEVWDYPDSSRTVVFRMDTVYAIMTSPRARLDSLNIWMDSTNNKAQKGLNKIGDKIENVADKVGNKLKKDTAELK